MKFIPLADRVIIKPIEQRDVTKGGIIIADVGKEPPIEGRVLAVGPGKRNSKGDLFTIPLKVDDKVLFSKYAGTEITTVDNDMYLILKEEEVLAIIPEE